jgi:hypothetical protein
LVKEAWAIIGGTDNVGISRKSFIIFIHALNNLSLSWMSENRSGFRVTGEAEV